MGKWAELALGAEKSPKRPSHQLTEPTKPPVTPLLSVLSVADSGISEDIEPRRAPLPKPEIAELKRLVTIVGRHWGFTEQEMMEAMQAALADQERALTCFRALAGEIPPDSLPTLAPGHKHVPVTINTASGRYSFYIDTTADLPNALFLAENERPH